MSTPIRRANQVDPALMYAPPRARKQGQTSSASPVDRPEHLGGTPDFTGDRAIMGLKRRNQPRSGMGLGTAAIHCQTPRLVEDHARDRRHFGLRGSHRLGRGVGP